MPLVSRRQNARVQPHQAPVADRADIATVAKRMVIEEGHLFGTGPEFRPRVQNPTINGGGSKRDGAYKSPRHLVGRKKSAVFAAEALYRAGFEPPYSSFRPRSGKRRYEEAPRWPDHVFRLRGQERLFDTVKVLKPGDLAVLQRWDPRRLQWSTASDDGVVLVATDRRPDETLVAGAGSSGARVVSLESYLEGRGTPMSAMTPDEDRLGRYLEIPEMIRMRFLRALQPR